MKQTIPVKIGIYGAFQEIGGNKICLQASNGKAILLDFGYDFTVAKQYFTGFMKLRPSEILLDGIALGFLPPPGGLISNIYRKDLLDHNRDDLQRWANFLQTASPSPGLLGAEQNMRHRFRPDLWSTVKWGKSDADGLSVTDVLLSHLHVDHCGLIGVLDPRINLVCGYTTHFLQTYLAQISPAGSPFRQVTECRNDEVKQVITRPIRLIQNCVPDAQYLSSDLPKFTPETGLLIADGGFRLWFMETDHSIVGAGAFFLEDVGTGKRFIYTGDLRGHGLLPKYYQKFLDVAKHFLDGKEGIIITEGTRLGLDQPLTPADDALVSYEQNEAIKQCMNQMKSTRYESENAVFTRIKDVLSKNPEKLTVFDCAGRDLWRFLVFYAAAKAANRTVVIDGDMFYLITKMIRRRWSCLELCTLADCPVLTLDDIEGDNSNTYFLKNLLVLDGKRRSGTYTDEDHAGDKVYKYLQELGPYPRIKAATIGQTPAKYCVYLPFSQMAQLHDIMPPDATHRLIYIHSSHFPEPDDGEGIDLLKKRLHWLDPYLASIEDFHHIHCSGHSAENTLKEMITAINPTKYLLIHTNSKTASPFSGHQIEVTALGSEITL